MLKRRSTAAHVKKPTSECQHGTYVFQLAGNIALLRILRKRKPRLGERSTKPGIKALVPLHRCTLRVTSQSLPGHLALPGIMHTVSRDLDISHPDLISVIHNRSARKVSRSIIATRA
jgi:hypothetical protein